MSNLLKIDALTLPDHPYLDPGDEVYYFQEFTPRKGPHHSATNDLVLNLKKSVDRRGKPEYKYKTLAINKTVEIYSAGINPDWAGGTAFVPVPCSKTANHALYDDRIIRICKGFTAKIGGDVREILRLKEDLESFHDGYRLPPDALAQHYEIDANRVEPVPTTVGIIDDVLTTGCHFKAARRILSSVWPDAVYVGIFLARVYRSGGDET